MKKVKFLIIQILLISTNIFAQNDSIIFKFQNLGLLDINNTYGGFDGGMGTLKVEILSSKINDQNIIIKGIVTDKYHDNLLSSVSIYRAEKDSVLKKYKIFTRHRYVEHKLNIKETLYTDKNGYFEIIINTNEIIYFGMLGYSLIECKNTLKKSP